MGRLYCDEAERLQRSHAIEEQDTVQVVVFVLDDARGEVACLELSPLSVPIERTHGDRGGAWDHAADVWDAQASFPVFGDIGSDRGDLRVDEDNRRSRVPVTGSHGFIVGHITPEAQEGGPIALVKNGDRITIDAETNRLDVDLTDGEIAARRKAWRMPPYKAKRGTLAKYIRLVATASQGCVTDELVN